MSIMGQKGGGLNRYFNSPPWLLGLFSAGVVCVRFLPAPGSPTFLGLALVLLLIGVARLPSIRWLLLFALGLGWAAFNAAHLLEKGIPRSLQKQDMTVTGLVTGTVRVVTGGSRFVFTVESLHHGDHLLPSPGRVQLTSYERNLKVESGERWRFTVRLKQPGGLSNPGQGFSRETWLFQQHIRATGYVVAASGQRIPMTSTSFFRVGLRVLGLRERFAEFIDRNVTKPVSASVLSALTVGIRSGLDEEAWRTLQHTGTTHLVAISGLHIGLVSMLAGLLGGRLWQLSPVLCAMIPVLTVAAITGLTAGTLYATLAGFTLPTRRAVWMLLAVVILLISRRRAKPLQLLLGVLTLVLAIDPLAPLSSSLWLSFGAVAILVATSTNAKRTLLAGRANRTSRARSKVKIGMANWSAMQFWLLLGMLPVLLAGFQKAALAGPPGNLLAVPLIGLLVVPVSLLSLLFWLAGVETIAVELLGLASWVTEQVWWYLTWLGEQPWAIWVQGLPPLWAIIAGAIGVVLLLLRPALPVRWLGALWLAPMLLYTPDAPAPGAVRVAQLDVGQGLATIIQTRRHTLIFDAGAARAGGFDGGKRVVAPTLRYFGVRHVDRLMISHGDNDHLGGAESVIRLFEPGSVMTSFPAQDGAPPGAVRCVSGDNWTWDGVGFHVLWPPIGEPYRGNNSSCVVLISTDSGSILLTGDIEAAAESRLARDRGQDLSADVLILAHHGSKSSTTARLLERVAPRLAIASTGYLNRFGHPAAAVRKRLQARDIPLLDTANEGAVTVTLSSAGIHARGQRRQGTAFWERRSDTDYDVINDILNREQWSATR